MSDVTKLFFVVFMECAVKVLHNLLLVSGAIFFTCLIFLVCYAVKCKTIK